ncbi:unnamed protein product [Didymodactylos carnosus]|uniref:Uncharacterized protein n=1 Tax=Didymodactylos carnosus TaxID=1234261 RepID=A0A815N565_9BILA|nr:unnamed protein product [Didymodactylos carnosus]CAF1427299.1 unnamed protein product [Didymodactylos carnosus]CAF4044991.1 unnamed protein product [Didymodactylos carnosus]CAF4307392.1 unnamed protein product [Didymodactylos carnosus]
MIRRLNPLTAIVYRRWNYMDTAHKQEPSIINAECAKWCYEQMRTATDSETIVKAEKSDATQSIDQLQQQTIELIQSEYPNHV